MAKIVTTEEVEVLQSDTNLSEWVYNALDSAVTAEICEVLLPQIPACSVQPIYDFERAQQGPVLEMMLRGLPIELEERLLLRDKLQDRLQYLQTLIDEFAYAIWDQPLNPRSHVQLKKLFYEVMSLPAKYVITKGERKLSTNRDCLERLRNESDLVAPIVSSILGFRDTAGLLQVLAKGIDRDGRIRTSYNIPGTETGRWSSSRNCMGTGDNLQNWTNLVRRIVVSDPGYKLAYCDLQSAESIAVAYLSGDAAYQSACESGDIHTYVAGMVFPNLPWHEVDENTSPRDIADRKFYRHFSYRDMCKRGGHGTNYYGQPRTMARFLKVPVQVMDNFQSAYFEAFPGIPIWHTRIAEELYRSRQITTAFGRVRTFWGAPDDDSTLREAIAFGPQSLVADYLNYGLLRLWRRIRRDAHPILSRIQILAQLHDAILVQYPPELEAEVIPLILETMTFPIEVNGQTLRIPADAEVGWNWAKGDADKPEPKNPAGLMKWSPDGDNRTRPAPKAQAEVFLDRRVSPAHRILPDASYLSQVGSD